MRIQTIRQFLLACQEKKDVLPFLQPSFGVFDGLNTASFGLFWQQRINTLQALHPFTRVENWGFDEVEVEPHLFLMRVYDENRLLLFSSLFNFDQQGLIISNESRSHAHVGIQCYANRWIRTLILTSKSPFTHVFADFPSTWSSQSLPLAHQHHFNLLFLSEPEEGHSFLGSVHIEYEYGPSEEKKIWFPGFDTPYHYNPEPFLSEDGFSLSHKNPTRCYLDVEYIAGDEERFILQPYETIQFKKPAVLTRLHDCAGFEWICAHKEQPIFDFD
jgi:hypothetical protein